MIAIETWLTNCRALSRTSWQSCLFQTQQQLELISPFREKLFWRREWPNPSKKSRKQQHSRPQGRKQAPLFEIIADDHIHKLSTIRGGPFSTLRNINRRRKPINKKSACMRLPTSKRSLKTLKSRIRHPEPRYTKCTPAIKSFKKENIINFHI